MTRATGTTLGAATLRFRPGQQIARRYRVQTLLGLGGMGEVYRAHDLRLGRDVALKVLPACLQERDARASERFLSQGRLAARVNHPAVVQVYDCDVDDGVPFVVHELLEGITLAEALAQGPLPAPAALELGSELTHALLAVHAAGVVHRDIKPSNLFLQNVGGQRPQLKLLDFGLARLLAPAQSLTRTGETFGTLSYMAPEQLSGAKRVRLQADVYALGAVLFELLTGRPPFVRSSRAALKLAVMLDPPPRVEVLVPRLPPGLSDVVSRALCKRPEERYANLSEFAAALQGVVRGAPQERSQANATFEPRAHESAAVRLLHRIGSGRHGEVFAAVDVRSGGPVALKRPRALDLESCLRLRHEFRALSALRHRHVVRAYELLNDAEGPALMMELIEGERFDRYRFGTAARLFAVMQQLSSALGALHAEGLAHLDLKPDNVLVEGSGRAVLIDLGAAAGWNADGHAAASKYAAPEARLGLRSAKADLFALGVMLEDALAAEPIRAESEGDRQKLALLRHQAARLCQREPALRPDAAELCALLAQVEGGAERASPHTLGLAGREREVKTLHAAFRAVLLQRAALFDVQGAPGSGKSALLDAFCDSLPAGTVCLRRRSTREGLRFPLFDPLVEALSEHLAALPAELQQTLLPHEMTALCATFPVLTRLSTVQAKLRLSPTGALDHSAVRTSFVEALRALLCALAEREPLVIALDDLHEADGMELGWLGQLLRAPGTPAALWLMARCPEPQSAELKALMQHLGATALRLAPLELDCAARWLGEALPQHAAGARALAVDCEGHPLLAAALVRGAPMFGGAEALSVDAVLTRAFERLSAPQKRLLHVLCLCDRPLPESVSFGAAEAGAHDLAELAAERWLRRTARDGIALYHVRQRRVLRAALAQDEARALHARIATLLLAHGTAFAARIEHLMGSGEQDAALALCQRWGDEAEQRGAFDQAAELYESALAHLPDESSAALRLLERLAYALHCHGRSRDAARVLLRLVERSPNEDVGRIEQRASELLVLSGDLAQGLSLLERTLARHDHQLPPDLSTTLQQTVEAYLALKQRGLDFVPCAREACDPSALGHAELLLSTALSLSFLDLRGLPFVFRALRAALDLGVEALIVRACALLVWTTVSHFPSDLVEPALGLCTHLVGSDAPAYERALLCVARSEHHHFYGRFLEAEAECERAEHLFVSECRAVAREIAGVRNLQAFLQYAHKGDFRSRVDETVRWMTEAEIAGNAYQLNLLRSAHALVWVARDRPEQARAELAAAEREWPRGVSAFEVTVALFLDVIDRYEGEPDVHLHPAQGRSALLLSPMAQTPLFRGYIELQRAWGALVALAAGQHSQHEAQLARTALIALRQLRLPLWDAVADAFEANLQLLSGQNEEAVALLSQSERTLRGLHMLCLAACARRRRGEATGGLVGERVQREAESELHDLGVVRVDKWCRAYFSPFPLTARALITIQTSA